MKQEKLIDILLVEDNRTYALLVQEALRDSSLFRLLHAQQLSEALLLLSQATIAVVLLDLGLPDSQGLETLRKLKESAPGIPVIVLTGHNDEQMALDSVQLGAQEYLVKSELQAGNLRRTIRHVIERARTEKALREAEAERRVLESQLRQSQKMEAIGQLVGGVAHDFNNLLTIILASCSEIQACESLSPKGIETLDNIHQASQRAVALTRQLLAFSRKQLLNPLVLNLNEIITTILKMALRLIGEDIELSWKPFPSLWPVKLDAGQIEQVLLNLVINARDAMPEGGQLSIETSNVEWSEEDCRLVPDRKPGCYAMLRISDNGTGIPPEVQSRIFEPFFTTKEVGNGTGLGLSVVHGIVKQSNGHVEVDSCVDKGTSFMLYFPVVKEHVAITPKDTSMLSPKVGTETVLLVEDEEGVRKIVRLALEKQGYTVIEAGNGQEALAAAESHSGVIKLVLTDVVLPVMSGRQLSKLLLARFPGIKVIYMTGYTDNAILRQGLNHDSHALLQKPFSMSELIQKVQAVLSEKPLDTVL